MPPFGIGDEQRRRGSRVETSYDVIVVGGGFAGVTAARDLSDQGLDVLLLEARDRLGGRTLYRPFEGTDQKVEFGGTWFGTQWHTNIAREIERYGTGIAYSPTPENYRWHVAGGLRSGFPVTLEEGHGFEHAMYELIAACKRLDF